MPGEVSENARLLIDTGAVGINIEDATRLEAKPLANLEPQIRKISAIRAVADDADIPLVINARTGAFRFAQGSTTERLEETIRRGKAYNRAGADCIFPFGVSDSESISTVVGKLDCPVNIIVGHGAPRISELKS